jgi:hypothetical protein
VHAGQTTNSARARFLRSVNVERRKLLITGREKTETAETGRQVLAASRALADASLDLLPAMLMVSTNSKLSLQVATLDRLDAVAATPATDWVMLLGNSWFHLGASRAFAQGAARPPIGMAVRSDCSQSVHMCRWYAGYLDFIVSADAAVDILLDGYLTDGVLRYRLRDPRQDKL